MPVIREDRKFGIQPIGVVRASQGGQITAEAVAKSAQQLGNIFYKRGAQYAEKTGTEQAQGVAREEITGIDPNTGKPIALTNLSNMGRVQAEAYERIVLRRFETSIEEDLSIKSSEIALANESEAAYTRIFSEYTAELANNATGMYSEFIQNTGSVIQAKTALALRENAIRRAQAEARAARAANAERNASIAQSLGMAAGSGNTAAFSGFAQLNQLNTEDLNDTGAFIGDQSLISAGQTALNAEFVGAYLKSSLAGLSSEDRTQLRRALEFGAPANLSDAGMSVLETASKYADPLTLSSIAAGLSAEITFLNSIKSDTEIQQENAVFNFGRDNLTLKLSLENQDFFNSASQNIDEGFALLERYRFDPSLMRAGSVNESDATARITSMGNAEDQVISGTIMNMMSVISDGMTDQQLVDTIADVKGQLETRNISGLVALYNEKAAQPLTDVQVNNVARLLSTASPADALTRISSVESIRQASLDKQQALADVLVTPEKLDEYTSGILDGSINAEEKLAELAANASMSDDYEKAVAAVENARDTLGVREILSRMNPNHFTKNFFDEMKLLSSGTDIPDSMIPSIVGSGFAGEIRSAISDISDVKGREAAISRLVDNLPNIDVQTSALYSSSKDAFQAQFTEYAAGLTAKTTAEIMSERDNLVSLLQQNTQMDVNDANQFIADVNREAGVALLGKSIIALTDPRNADSVILAVQSGDPSLASVDDQTKQMINDSVSGLNADQRNDLAQRLRSEMLTNREVLAAEEEQKYEQSVITAYNTQGGYIPEPNSQRTQDILRQNILMENGVEQFPSDMFNNFSSYVAKANAGDPEGKAVVDLVNLSTRVMMPELAQYLSAAATGGVYAGRVVDFDTALGLWNHIGSSIDPQNAAYVRSESATSAGIDPVQIGILDGLSSARAMGVPAQYYDEIRTVLSNKERRDSLVASLPDGDLYGFVRSAIGGRAYDENPAYQQDLANYALGLMIASGSNQSLVKQQLDNFFKSSFYEDRLTVNPFGMLSSNVRVGIERAFPDNYSRTAAIQLMQVDAWATEGARLMPDAPIEQQIQAGRDAYVSNYIPISLLGRNMSTYYGYSVQGVIENNQRLGGKQIIAFVPSRNSTNQTATFYAYSADENGNMTVIPSAQPIRNTDPMVLDLGKRLEVFSRTTEESTGFSSAAMDFIINYYIYNKGR